jgi:hypothetical protein
MIVIIATKLGFTVFKIENLAIEFNLIYCLQIRYVQLLEIEVIKISN